jgi:hypothetical protein
MLSIGSKVEVLGYTGTVIEFIPRWENDNTFASVVLADQEISCGEGKGNILIMQLRYAEATWGGTTEIDRVVGVILCPDLESWRKHSGCVLIDQHLTYKIL